MLNLSNTKTSACTINSEHHAYLSMHHLKCCYIYGALQQTLTVYIMPANGYSSALCITVWLLMFFWTTVKLFLLEACQVRFRAWRTNHVEYMIEVQANTELLVCMQTAIMIKTLAGCLGRGNTQWHGVMVKDDWMQTTGQIQTGVTATDFHIRALDSW